MPSRSLKRSSRRLQFLLCLLAFFHNSFSQHNETPFVAWYFPGVTYKASSNVELRGQFIVNDQQDIYALYLQGFIKAGKHFILNPAYLYLNIDRSNGASLKDHTLMNSVFYTFNISKLVVDDRNMLWNRFRFHEKDAHFYRNRLRLTLPVQLRTILLRPYVFDEVTYSITDGAWTRNRLAVGLGCKLTKWLLLDAAFLREHDKYNGQTNLLFLMALIELSHHKVERNSQHN